MAMPVSPQLAASGRHRVCALAIDAGGTQFKSALIGPRGGVLPGSSFRTASCSAGDRAAILEAYRLTIAAGIGRARESGVTIAGLGVATPGPFDYAGGISRMTHKFQAIEGLPLREAIRGLHLLPDDVPICFQQDVHAFLAGEQWTGAVRGVDDVAAVTLGTGLGFGIMRRGVILDNGRGGPARVIYNLPFGPGILEDRISGRGIAARYRELAPAAPAPADVRAIARRARRGYDATARRVFEESGQVLADHLAGFLQADPVTHVVFGGQISKAFAWFGPAFARRLREQGVVVQALPGQRVNASALVGVARLVLR